MEPATAFYEYARMPKLRSQSPSEIRERLVLLRRAVAGDGRGSQVAFCRRVGLTTNTWNNLERRDGARISLDTALLLAQSLGVSLDWIFRGEAYERQLPGDLIEKLRAARETAADSADAEKRA